MEKILRIMLVLAAAVMIVFFLFMFIFIIAVPDSTTAVTTPIENAQALSALWQHQLA